MKKFVKLIDYIEVNIFTIIILIISFLLGKFKDVFLLFIIAAIHELFHLFACLMVKVKIKKITILPFGLCLLLNESEYIISKKQIIISIFGPLSVLFNILWIIPLFKLNFLSEHTYQFLFRINIMMCVMNLLPIHPLDGYSILNALLQQFFPYKKALKISIVISCVFFIFFVIYNFFSFQLMVTLFLLFEQIKHIIKYKTLYRNFLIYKSQFKKHKKFKIIDDYLMFKDYNNYQIANNKILSDVEIASFELKKYIEK
ncbi:MAG: site-2 protease family protein [Erysipelotrichaceae bacterium]|nr:site-2 protease family protein [Erysipelotrichaceae bacterium]